MFYMGTKIRDNNEIIYIQITPSGVLFDTTYKE